MYENETRSHDWLMRYANQKVQPDPRIARYIAGLLAVDRPLDLDKPLSAHGSPYHFSRGTSALLGRKAFLFRTPGTPHYQSPAVVDEIVRGLKVFRDCQDRGGDFVLGDAWTAYLPHHEHAWRLEPMIWARIWLDSFLAAKDKVWIDAMLRRAARRLLWFARQSPNDTLQYCNRGAVWCAVTTLAGLYFDEREYLREVKRHAERILINTLTARGEILEGYLHYYGGGPDLGYSVTTWVYAIMYRILSGNAGLDDRLIQCQKWSTLSLTHTGHALATGASSRHAMRRAWVCDLMPGFEFFAGREPFFDVLADRLLGAGVEHGQGHCVHPFIWAMFSHRARQPLPEPAWYRDHESHYEHQASQYSLIHHRYQTGVTWRGIHPVKGLQTFALGNEAPIVFSTPGTASKPGPVSTVLSGRLSSTLTNISAGSFGWEIFRRTGGTGDGYEPESPATWIIARRGRLWEFYAFTPASVIYAAGGAPALRMRLALLALPESRPRLGQRARRVTFAGRKGLIAWLAGRGRILAERNAPVLEISAGKGALIIGLGGPDLRWQRFNARTRQLRFSDASGRYELCLDGILDRKGQIDREPARWYRLKKIGKQ